MKRALTVLCLLLGGCMNTQSSVTALNVEAESMYGRMSLIIHPEDRFSQYEVNVLRADNETALYTYPTEAPAIRNAGDLIAYAACQNDYYGNVILEVTAYDSSRKKAAECRLEPVAVTDYYPAEKELLIGTDIDPQSITSVYWSGSGSESSQNFLWELEKTDEGTIVFTANSFSENGVINIERREDPEVFDQALEIVKKGKMIRRNPEDPEFIILDGSEQSIHLRWDGESELQKSWYQFESPERSELIQFLKEQANQESASNG